MIEKSSWKICLTCCVLALGFLFTSCGENDAGPESGQSHDREATPVKVTPVAERLFEAKVKAQGTLRTKHYAVISSRLAGTLESVPVDEGDQVKGGETVLFCLDSRNLKQDVAKAEADLLSLQANVHVAEANVQLNQTQLQKALWDKERYVRLYEQQTATKTEYESYLTAYDSALANLKYAEANAEAARAQVKQGEAALSIARKNLEDAEIKAPFDGVLTKRYAEPGEEVGAGDKVFMLEDLSLLEVTVSLPARYYPMIAPGQTKLRLRVSGQEAGEHTVTYRSPTIEDGLRTFEVKAIIRNDGQGLLVSGAMLDAEFVLDSHRGLGVPSHAVLMRAAGSQVLLADGDKARTVLVKAGLEDGEWQEIVGDGIVAGVPVISEGQYLLENGSAIRVVE